MLITTASNRKSVPFLYTDRRNNATKVQVQRAVSKLDLNELEPIATRKELCGRLYPSTCDPAHPYRTLDGSCNNLANPSWGKALSCHSRIAPAVHGDGKSGCERRRR
ncbi:hypothetical protein V5799_009645 [Amblyomma americanum]|uniref:Uncharacterized protein n=1 Tax=Amblyomma americanum TaxID=6943 RepID=A0AAQ4F9T2_AMBAM